MPEQNDPPGEQKAQQKAEQKSEQKGEQKTESKIEVKTVSDILQSVQIALDGYDDLFSDFDPSPYETKMLSDDFLAELRKRYAETKSGELVVNFTIPANQRSDKTDALVKKRLKDYFKYQHTYLAKKVVDTRMRGLLRVAGGAAVLVVAFGFASSISLALENLLLVPSWFLLWSGFDSLIDAPTKLSSEMRFNERFMKAKYNFVPQEEIVKSINIRSSYV
ncbi:hypothetical protein H0O00_01485 [Candidatus Micrarchaeota archaeon]|nr:hypothetical protein [Candidatus Micrarchaeota archaeon]